MYVARKRLKIDGVYREIGQEVPEALEWRTVESYIRAGVIDWVEEPKPKKRAVAKQAAEPEKPVLPKEDKTAK